MEEIKTRAEKLLEKINLDQKRQQLREIEAAMTKPGFWNDHQGATAQMKQLSALQKEIEEAEYLQELIKEEKYQEAEKLIEKLENLLYLSGQYDQGNAILAIHSGQGGTEAMDWTQMLFRLYTRYFERKGWSYEIVEETPGEETGLKSVSLSVEGQYAYGYLKGEAGVHRLVRLSPFNSDNLRQTSFAMVEVLPAIADGGEVEIKEDDIEWDFFRAGGHGGQNVNKVSTAVRLKHIPSGMIVTAHSERYQGKNREIALKLLRAKLWLQKEEERKKKEAQLKGGYKTPGWGNQIRSYVLHPYRMVKDLRTGVETSNTDAVLDGQIDEFVDEELRQLS